MVPNRRTMDSTENGEHNGKNHGELSFNNQTLITSIQIEEAAMDGSSSGKRLMDFIYVPTIEKGLMPKSHHDKRFLDFLRARPTNDWFLKFGFIRRSLKRANPAAQSLPSVPATTDRPRRRRFRVQFVRKIDWKNLFAQFMQWLKSPANIAIFVWTILCAIGIFWVLLFMVGAMKVVMPDSDQRDKWEEVINQILNVLFTLMCIYQHPVIFHHLVLVLRWKPDDQVAARSAYSKNGIARPHDRAHIFFVVSLLHLTCADQYAYCALFWGWSRENRPDWPQYLLIAFGFIAPTFAAWYTYYGPLAKNMPDSSADEESCRKPESEGKLYHRRVVVTSPEWIGGLFDCWDDMTVFYLSFFCTFCVFGWNLERLGFGNMYVHIVTFILLCVAPFWIFSISAINVDNDTIRLIVAISGALCGVFGLIYGGYWRSEIRKKFKLPGNTFCCGYPMMTDYAQWLFCWSCSLAQEVRTANFYDIETDGFSGEVNDEEVRHVLVPLQREGNEKSLNSVQSLSSPSKDEDINAISPREMPRGCKSPKEIALGTASAHSKVHAMTPPLQPVMQTDK